MHNLLIYRLILILFSIWIVQHNENVLPEWIYYVCFFIYFVGSICRKRKNKDIDRLLWDFIFINGVVYGKDIHDPMAFMFIIIPMINAVNYIGKKTHLGILSIFTLITLLVHMQKFEGWITTPIISLGLMCFVSSIKYRNWKNKEEISNIVNSYFLDSSMLKPHQIYESIIKELNSYFKLKDVDKIRMITTYTIKGNTLWLVSASDFLWNRTRKITEEQILQLRNKHKLKLEEDDLETYMFYIKIGEIEYVFTCEISKTSILTQKFFRFEYTMQQTFSRMSTLLSTEYRIKERRENKFNEIKDSVQYVNQAVNVMHFIRNRMTPLSNLIAYHKAVGKMPNDIKKKMETNIKKEVAQADKDLKDIMKTAEYLLDKSKDPFKCTEKEEISLIKIYVVLSEITERLMEQVVDVDESVKNATNDNIHLQTNLTECKIMFTDWLNNMNKYSKGGNRVSMFFEGDKLHVHFENNCSMNVNNMDKLVRDMNSDEKDAVLEGKNYGHGIYIIKSLAKELGVEIKATKVNKQTETLLCLDFIFLTHGRK